MHELASFPGLLEGGREGRRERGMGREGEGREEVREGGRRKRREACWREEKKGPETHCLCMCVIFPTFWGIRIFS